MPTLRDVSAVVDSGMLAEIEALADYWDRTLTHTIGVLLRCGLDVAVSEMVCRDCGCTVRDDCIDDNTGDACSWAGEDLCTACASRQVTNDKS